MLLILKFDWGYRHFIVALGLAMLPLQVILADSYSAEVEAGYARTYAMENQFQVGAP